MTNNNGQLPAAKFKGEVCPFCGGTGFAYDSASVRQYVSTWMRKHRSSQNSLANTLAVSHSYMSQLMAGKKRWNFALVNKLLAITKN